MVQNSTFQISLLTMFKSEQAMWKKNEPSTHPSCPCTIMKQAMLHWQHQPLVAWEGSSCAIPVAIRNSIKFCSHCGSPTTCQRTLQKTTDLNVGGRCCKSIYSQQNSTYNYNSLHLPRRYSIWNNISLQQNIPTSSSLYKVLKVPLLKSMSSLACKQQLRI